MSLVLETVEPALGRSVIPAIFFTAHRAWHAKRLGRILKGVVGILGGFTSFEFTRLFKDNGIAISMDGRGCWCDYVFVERLWKSIKYEEVYLRSYDTVSQAREGIGRYLNFYNTRQPHSALDALTPDEYYYQHLPALQQAA